MDAGCHNKTILFSPFPDLHAQMIFMILVQHHSRSLTFLLRFKFHPGLYIECIIFLTDSEIGTMIAVRYFFLFCIEPQHPRPVTQGIVFFTDFFYTYQPFVRCFLPKTDMIGSTAYFLWKTVFFCGQFQCIFQMPDAFCNHRPSIFPCDFCQKSLSAHAAVSFTRSGCQHYHIPVSPSILHQISVSCVDHRIVFPQIPVGEDRVSGAALEPLEQLFTSGNAYAVLRSGSSFCMHQIIITVDLIKVRSLRPDNSFYSPFPDCHAFSHKLHLPKIQFLHPDFPVSVIADSFRIRSRTTVIAFPVIIEEKTGIDPRSIFAEIIRIRPRSCWIFCRYNEIASVAYIGSDHVKQSIMEPDGWCINPL